MLKTEAVKMFGSPTALAEAIGIRVQSVSGWPDELPARVADRVVAAVARAKGIDLMNIPMPDVGQAYP